MQAILDRNEAFWAECARPRARQRKSAPAAVEMPTHFAFLALLRPRTSALRSGDKFCGADNLRHRPMFDLVPALTTEMEEFSKPPCQLAFREPNSRE